MQKLKTKVQNLLEVVKNSISENDFINASQFIEYNEFGVVFNLICNQLYENEATISTQILQEIQDIAKLMEIDENSWCYLKECVDE